MCHFRTWSAFALGLSGLRFDVRSGFSQHLHYSSNMLIAMTGGLGAIEKTSDKVRH
jgi:hypothetical protein